MRLHMQNPLRRDVAGKDRFQYFILPEILIFLKQIKYEQDRAINQAAEMNSKSYFPLAPKPGGVKCQ